VLTLVANVYYKEDELIEGLGCSRKWLRRKVGKASRRGEERIYLGSDVLAAFEPCPPTAADPTPTIYFVQSIDGGPVKIGYTTQLPKRLADLRSMNPRFLVLLASMPGTEDDERRLHERFSTTRLHGEWFKSTTDLVALIASVG